MKLLLFFYILIFSFTAYSIPIPKDNKVIFEIIRKNKVIGTHEIEFNQINDKLIIDTNINIAVKILFFPAYKFFHTSREVWINDKFSEIEGFTDFEDEREYKISGKINKNSFIGNGMDGKINLDKLIIPSNFWNINLMQQKEAFDTQKGIIRKLEIKYLGEEEIELNKKKIICNKYTLNASSNKKDKGPFPEYTLWYNKQNELLQYKFINWRDDKEVKSVRKE
tara:strand:+ start:4178 stop:4846 length:669 start_codon:yes stop_codon:yes gene_type:complete